MNLRFWMKRTKKVNGNVIQLKPLYHKRLLVQDYQIYKLQKSRNKTSMVKLFLWMIKASNQNTWEIRANDLLMKSLDIYQQNTKSRN